MTVTTSAARIVHNGDGATIIFSVPFQFLENAHVSVFHRDSAGVQTLWVENTQYTLVGAGDPAGGTLTVLITPTDYTPATLESLVVLRDISITQESDYVENDPLPSETIERDFDKGTMIDQQIGERLDRTFTVPEADTAAGSFELPIDTVRASKFLAFDSVGDPIVATGTVPTTAPITAYAETLLAADTAAAFLTGLTVTSYAQTLLDDADAATARATLGTLDEEQIWLIGQTFG